MGVRVVVGLVKLDYFRDIGLKAAAIANAAAFVEVMKDDDAAAVLISNIPKFIDAITCIGTNEINIHTSQA